MTEPIDMTKKTPGPDAAPGQAADSSPVPPPPSLGPAAAHLAAAEAAAGRADFATALRERYRAVTRGLEQSGILTEERGRTARETAREAGDAVPEAGHLPSAAHNFDEVVYGGRAASEAEYRMLAEADRYSGAPPPKDRPAEITEKRKTRKPAREKKRGRPELPPLLTDRRVWAGIALVLVVAALIYAVTHLGSPSTPAPDMPSHPTQPPHPTRTPDRSHAFDEGDDSIFQTLPGWLAFGGLQFLIAWAAVLWWRGRRRGAVVDEPLPVEAPADELLTGQAGLYRNSRDHGHIAGKLRSASLRRLRPALNLTADATPESVIGAIGVRTGLDPGTVRAALYDPVSDRGTLELVAAQLEWIEAEVL